MFHKLLYSSCFEINRDMDWKEKDFSESASIAVDAFRKCFGMKILGEIF